MRESDKRWKAAIRIVGEAVGQQDILGLAGPNIGSISLRPPVGHHPALPHTDKVHGFGHWLANLLDAAVLARDGSWMLPFLGEAAQLAARRAREIGVAMSSPAPIPASTHSLAASELRGIIASSTQHGTRAAATALASKQRPLAAAREVAKSLHIGMQRSRLMTDYLASKAFTHATIGIYRAAGVGQVGIIPERLKPRRRVRDARANLVSTEPEGDDVVAVETAGDARVCEQCQEISDGSPYSLDEAMELIPAHPNAVLQGTTIASYGAMHQMVRARFCGPAVYLRTRTEFFAIGPNHPMMTRRGWRKAREICEGDELLYDLRVERGSTSRRASYLEQMPMVEDIAEAAAFVGAVLPTGTAHDLHGDRIFCEGKVDVVCPARGLLPVLDPCGIEHFSKDALKRTNVQAPLMAHLRASLTSFARFLLPASGFMGGSSLMLALSGGHLAPFDVLLLARGAAGDARAIKNGIDNPAACAEFRRQAEDAGPGQISGNYWPFRWDRVIEVHVRWFSGLAFDGSTATGLYNNNGYVVSNCRCAIVPSSTTMSDLPLTGMIGGLAGLLAEPGPPEMPITPEITPEEIKPEEEPGPPDVPVTPEVPEITPEEIEPELALEPKEEPEEEPELEPGLEEEPLEEPAAEAEAKGIPGWMVGAAATLGGVALAALLSRGREEPIAVPTEAEAAAAEEAPEDYPEFTGTTPQEYVDYAQQLFAWAVAMNWPVDALEERWDEDAEARARIGMDEDQESSLENQMAQASALLE